MNYKSEFPDLSLTLIWQYQRFSLAFLKIPWLFPDLKNFVFPWLFPDRGNLSWMDVGVYSGGGGGGRGR